MRNYLRIIGVAIVGLFITSCGLFKEVPVEHIEKVEYRDSLIFIHDTISIPVPVEKIKEVVPAMDTSFLKTSVAESVAYLDTAKRRLHHTLEQKGNIKIVYDTIFKVEYVDRFIEKEVPVVTEVIKYKRDALFWVLALWGLLCVAYAIFKLSGIRRV